MTWRNITQTTLGQTARRVPRTFLDPPLDRLLALVREWRTRRNIKRGLGHLSNFLLRDVGLTKADVESACADSFDRSALARLRVQRRTRREIGEKGKPRGRKPLEGGN
ncbi:DUF1127 domain-containing protein [Mesorhizobium sp. M7A.F.Ca.US.010.02.1.1]|uniref:DUF1127 domain-containing protein n=1 Tax=unclassified Mesorhizobium TaxID=325217 RepID=UPI000FD5715C|nr:DUF1127 domain-containing protein [Mesorhizobium sp. M7A.F.Ca.US.010.02.1.1]RUW90229.1 DUF1127 domain-containing protein [Mesorhizobium sp. M7A.F.Ca.US.010.02.1.1]